MSTSSQNGGADETGNQKLMNISLKTSALPSASVVRTTHGSKRHEGTDCLHDVIINSVDLCRLADAQFVDRMQFDRKFQHATRRKKNDDGSSMATAKKTENAFQTENRSHSSFRSAPSAASRYSGSNNMYDGLTSNARKKYSRTLTDLNESNFHRSDTINDVTTSDVNIPLKTLVDLSSCNGTGSAADDTGNGYLTSEEVMSLSTSSPRRAMLSFYNLSVWPEKGGPVGGSRRTQVYRANGVEHRSSGSIDGAQKWNGDQNSAVAEESNQSTKFYHKNSGRSDGVGTSADRMRSLRHSYPDDPILRRILGTGIQVSGQNTPQTLKYPTFVSPALPGRVRTGSRRPGTESSSRSAVPSRGGRSLRKPEGVQSVGTADGRGLFPDATALPTTASAGGQALTGQRRTRNQRRPSVTLMFERSVTKIEPGWKTAPSHSLATDVTGTSNTSSRRDANTTSGIVAVVIEDDYVISDGGRRKQSWKQSRSSESDCQRINASAASLLSIATSGLIPRPPCNSPDQPPDDYFWSESVLPSHDSQQAVNDKRPAQGKLLSHSEFRHSAAQRFQRSSTSSASRSSSRVAAATQRSYRANTSGVETGAGVESGRLKFQTTSSNSLLAQPERVVDLRKAVNTGGVNVSEYGVPENMRSDVGVTQTPSSRLVVYVPH